MSSIGERNRQILQMRKKGVQRNEVARTFELSPTRIWLIEKQDAATRSMAERQTKLRKQIQDADDMDKLWPIEDVLDGVGLIMVTKKRLLDHFGEAGKKQISLGELMDMCFDAPVEGQDFTMTPLLRAYGVGKMGFWSVVNGLTNMDLGGRCNEEWQWRLVKVKQKWKITGATPYSSLPGWVSRFHSPTRIPHSLAI